MKLWAYFGTAVLACGCNQVDSNSQAGTTAALNASGVVNQPSTSPVSTQAPGSLEGKSHTEKPNSAPELAATPTVSGQDLSQILAPIAKDECFFSAPNERQPVVQESKNQLKESEPKKDSVRLLGFIQVGSDGAEKNQAILRIEGKLAYVTEGDRIEDLEVLSVSAPEVTLQQHRQRWSIRLSDQPRSQPASTSHFVSTAPRSSHAKKQSALQPHPVPQSHTVPDLKATRDTDPLQPETATAGSAPPEPELPALPQLPELPELPDPPELPSDPLIDE